MTYGLHRLDDLTWNASRAAAADSSHRTLREPRCNTLHHQMQFVAKYCKLWNCFVTSVPENALMKCMKSIQAFKTAVHRWLTERNS